MNRSETKWRSVAAAAAICWCLAGWSAPVEAANPRTSNPSHSDPHAPLAIHGDTNVVELQAACEQRYAKLLKEVPALVQRETKGQPDKNDPDTIGDCHVAVTQLARIARRLSVWGEPAGHDFNQRASYYQGLVSHLVGSYSMTPAGSQFANAVRQRLPKTERERAATLKKARELVAKQNFAEAEEALLALIDKLSQSVIFLPAEEQRQVYEPFSELLQLCTSTMDARRMTIARDALVARRDAERPKWQALASRIQGVGAALATTPQVPWDDTPVTGPEAFSRAVAEWQKLHAQAIRYQGLVWALSSPGGGMLGPTGGAPPAPVADAPSAAAKGDPFSDEYREKSAGSISAALASLIDAEARRATPAEVPALHRAWLEAAAPVVGRIHQGKLAAALEPALMRLAAKSPEYLAQVQAYEAATTELLRWKRRSAEAAVAPLVAQQPALEAAFQKATVSGQGYTGLFAFEKPDFPHPQLLAAAPNLLPPATEKLLQQPVILAQGQGLSRGKTAATRLRQRTFATVKLPADSLAAAVASLEQQLLVSAEQPPLTLAATAALRSLHQGDFVTAGGEISGLYLEGWITRLAGLPDAAAPIVAFGDLPTDAGPPGFGISSLSQAAMRFEVTPKWFRHEYLVVPAGN